MALNTSAQRLRIVSHDDETVLNLALLQGLWTQDQYLRLTDYSRRLLEFTDGSDKRGMMARGREPVVLIEIAPNLAGS